MNKHQSDQKLNCQNQPCRSISDLTAVSSRCSVSFEKAVRCCLPSFDSSSRCMQRLLLTGIAAVVGVSIPISCQYALKVSIPHTMLDEDDPVNCFVKDILAECGVSKVVDMQVQLRSTASTTSPYHIQRMGRFCSSIFQKPYGVKLDHDAYKFVQQVMF